MNFQDILNPDCTLCAVSGGSKKRVLETISEIAATQIPSMTKHDLLESLLKREQVGSTGIGGGIAIPHGKLSSHDEVVCVVLTTEQPITFDAIDNRPVDIFIALFVPEEKCNEHICTLQSIAKVFNDKETCKKARKCESNQALFELIQQQK